MEGDDDLSSLFAVPEGPAHPEIIAERLMNHDEHAHLSVNEIKIEYLFRGDAKLKGGKQVLGSVHLPSCQGEMRGLFEWMLGRLFGYLPHFLCIIDQAWWEQAGPRDREALLWHELCHVKQDVDQYGALRFNRQTGEPIYKLVEHDVAAFRSEVERYGAWSPDLVDFLAAANRSLA